MADIATAAATPKAATAPVVFGERAGRCECYFVFVACAVVLLSWAHFVVFASKVGLTWALLRV
jgi:hypothetical protein